MCWGGCLNAHFFLDLPGKVWLATFINPYYLITTESFYLPMHEHFFQLPGKIPNTELAVELIASSL